MIFMIVSSLRLRARVILLLLCALFVVPSTVFAAPPRLNPSQALFAAIEKNDLAAVKTLLDRGLSPNTRDHDRAPALWMAALQGQDSIVRLLLDRGADANDKGALGRSPLHVAVRPETARLLIQHGADVNASDREGNTPLMDQTGNSPFSHPEIVKILLQAGADPNRRNREGATALMITSWWPPPSDFIGPEESDAEIAGLLVRGGADPNAQDPTGMTALMGACAADHAPIVKALLANGAGISIQDRRGRTALTWAARRGKFDEIVQMLLQHGAHARLIDHILTEDTPAAVADLGHTADTEARGPHGETPLIAAAEKGDLNLVRALLAHGADPNAHEDADRFSLPLILHWRPPHPYRPFPEKLLENKGATALMLALAGSPDSRFRRDIVSGDPKDPARLEIINDLLAHGADVNAADEGGATALFWAIPLSPLPVIRVLLDHGADIHLYGDLDTSGKTTVLVLVARYKRPDVTEALLARGADPNAGSPGGNSPLTQAAEEGEYESVRLLLDHGAKVNLRRWDGGTALISAADGGFENIVQILLDHRANVNAKNRDGFTALMAAASIHERPLSLKITQLLLSHHADISARDKDGAAALTYAAINGKTDPTVEFLLAHRARIDLLDAILLGDEATALTKLQAGADPNVKAPYGLYYTEGRTALMLAAQSAQLSLAKALLDHGARVNDRDQERRTALFWALGGTSDWEPGKFAVDQLNEPDMQTRLLETIRLLLAHGAEVNKPSSGYQFTTPLILAAARATPAIVQLLLEHGADTTIKDYNGETALQWAEERHRPEIVTLLKQAGAQE